MITINTIAEFIGGKVIGDGNLPIKGMASPEFATEGDITFALSEEGFKSALASKASCVLATQVPPGVPKPILEVKDMKEAMVMLYNAMLKMTPPAKGSVDPKSIVSEKAILGENVIIGPGAIIGDNVQIGNNSHILANSVISKDVKIGDNVIIYPNVTIYAQCVIGNRCIIHAGAVIGADGFGFVQKDNVSYKVPQLSNVILEDDVEIGANTCIDRGTFTSTHIGKGVKIDNLCQIAHNIKMEKNVIIAAQVGIAGSTTIGENTMIGGSAGITDHATIGKNCKIGGRSGVHGSVGDNKIVLGFPARQGKEFMTMNAILTQIVKHKSGFLKFLRTLPLEKIGKRK